MIGEHDGIKRCRRGHIRVYPTVSRSEEHTSELQSLTNLVCRLLLEKKKKLKRAEVTGGSQTGVPARHHRRRPGLSGATPMAMTATQTTAGPRREHHAPVSRYALGCE